MMIQILLIPPFAFLLYLLLVSVLTGIGRVMAGTHHSQSSVKLGAYASGEEPQSSSGAPGYRPFFQGALFFAILHLGVLVLASGGLSPISVIYLIGLIVALMALILG